MWLRYSVVIYQLVYTKQAQRDTKKISRAGLKKNVLRLLEILEQNPFQSPPRYEKLLGDLSGAYSRRINIQHRLVYQVLEEDKVVKVLRMWTHYEWVRGFYVDELALSTTAPEKDFAKEYPIHRLSTESFSTFIYADYKVLRFMLTKDWHYIIYYVY